MMRPSVLIIGGGPAGLTTALRLSARGYAVTLLEQGGELGGRLIRSAADAIPPVFLGSHRASLSLLKTLGTARHVRFAKGINLEFLARPGNSGNANPAHGIGHLPLEPARAQLLPSGATHPLGTAGNQIRFDVQRVSGVDLQTGGTLAAEWYVAALPHRGLYRLLPEGALARYSYFQQLTGLTDSPALTVHLWLDRLLPGPRLLLLPGKTYHWMVSRPDGGPKHVSLVTTRKVDVLDGPNRELLEDALHDVR